MFWSGQNTGKYKGRSQAKYVQSFSSFKLLQLKAGPFLTSIHRVSEEKRCHSGLWVQLCSTCAQNAVLPPTQCFSRHPFSAAEYSKNDFTGKESYVNHRGNLKQRANTRQAPCKQDYVNCCNACTEVINKGMFHFQLVQQWQQKLHPKFTVNPISRLFQIKWHNSAVNLSWTILPQAPQLLYHSLFIANQHREWSLAHSED